MFDSEILEVGMGLMLVYLVLSLVCTALNEFVANLIKGRHLTLKKGVRMLLEDGLPAVDGAKTKAAEFLEHDLVRKLGKKPSYITPETFARVLSDMLVPATPGASRTIDEFRDAIEALPKESQLRRPLLLMLESAGQSLEDWQLQLETWFNDVMDRVAGWYKRKTQLIVMAIALLVALAANADTFAIAHILARNDALRSNLLVKIDMLATEKGELHNNLQLPESGSSPDVDIAIKSLEELEAKLNQDLKTMSTLSETVDSLGLPLGWNGGEESEWTWRKLLGLLITAMAISLGAPFWFEMLRKAANFRAAGRRPDGDGKRK